MMQRFLSAGLFTVALLLGLTCCVSTKKVSLYDSSKVRPMDVAHLVTPIDIEILDVDGTEIDSLADILIGTENDIEIAPGDHEITVRYSDFWEYDRDNFEKFRSRKITLKFQADAGRYYQLVHPNLRNIREAERFTENPEIWIQEIEKGSELPASETDSGKASSSVAEKGSATEAVSADQEDKELQSDWDSMSDEEKRRFREWMDQRDKE
ncbi:MAG: DUF2057 family protein [Acidobacteriota bacterium]|jgi:uncharacterized protein YccT (UPF0319 family)